MNKEKKAELPSSKKTSQSNSCFEKLWIGWSFCLAGASIMRV